MHGNWNDYQCGEDKQDWEIFSSILSFLKENKWKNHMKNQNKKTGTDQELGALRSRVNCAQIVAQFINLLFCISITPEVLIK